MRRLDFHPLSVIPVEAGLHSLWQQPLCMRGMMRQAAAATVEKDKGVNWGCRAEVVVGVADG